MNKNYRAVPYRAHVKQDYHCCVNDPLENYCMPEISETRFRIISVDTGEVLDDAQGYGYKTAQKAYAGFAYKNQCTKKCKKKQFKNKQIKKWLRENELFASLLEDCAFRIAKGDYGEDVKFDSKMVEDLLKTEGLQPNFTANELLEFLEKR